MIVGRAKVKIPRTGDWTIGVHSDEGFGLRFIGAAFKSVNGSGELDDNFPEFMVQQNNTTDSNSRGILKNLVAGTYEIEFISWERVGSAFCEVYAAEGAFAEDADSDQWKLIGAPGGLEIVARPPQLNLIGLSKNNEQVTLEFTSTSPGLIYQLQESSDLIKWLPVPSAGFQDAGGNKVRATANSVTAAVRFYRIALAPYYSVTSTRNLFGSDVGTTVEYRIEYDGII